MHIPRKGGAAHIHAEKGNRIKGQLSGRDDQFRKTPDVVTLECAARDQFWAACKSIKDP